MCGIFGYIGPKNALDIALHCLKRLEYRGYDSAGIAGLEDQQIKYSKISGKVADLESKLQGITWNLNPVIAHTRWATHGIPSESNAHPHFDQEKKIAIVHNGIIENASKLKRKLPEKGIHFRSKTDSEVIAHLIRLYYQDNLLAAVRKALSELEGSYALAIISADDPTTIIAAAKDSSLAIGVGKEEMFVASDIQAFQEFTEEVIFLKDAQIAVLTASEYHIYEGKQEIPEKTTHIHLLESSVDKGFYSHYTLKEIFEEPTCIQKALENRIQLNPPQIHFEELHTLTTEYFQKIQRILIIACGTSWHAGYIASYILEDHTQMPVDVEIASELRYKNPLIQPDTLVIAISQSGETADTLAAIKIAKSRGAKILGLCNVEGSALTREANDVLYLRSGPEIGVCSTKALISQLILLILIAYYIAETKHIIDKKEIQELFNDLNNLPELCQSVLDQHQYIHELSEKYVDMDNYFFVGRRHMYPASLEGALKLKEIAYVNAQGYPAGELKHGPIALMSPKTLVIGSLANEATLDKTLSNLMEVKSREGKIFCIASENTEGLEFIADDILWIPRLRDELSPILTSTALQLFAYYIALKKGCHIDQPRNLAKSVTVE